MSGVCAILSIGLKNGVPGDTPFHPRGRLKGYTFFNIIFYYTDLADVWIGKSILKLRKVQFSELSSANGNIRP